MLSIIIPTLNEENYLPRLLDSIEKQTFKNYEIIVADGGSTDKTIEIAKQRGCSVVRGGLPAVGRNKGGEVANGDFLLFLDTDIVLPNKFFENMLNEFEKHKLDVASCFTSPLSDKKIDDILYGFGNLYYRLNQYIKPRAPGCCILIRKEAHQKIKGFDEKIKMAEDWDYINRVSKDGKFKFIKGFKIPVSARRYDRDGRLNVATQRIMLALYYSLFGNVKSDSLLLKDYHFGDYHKKQKPIIDVFAEFSNKIKNKEKYAQKAKIMFIRLKKASDITKKIKSKTKLNKAKINKFFNQKI
jgi:glycosyltransferase involved in cell wall biosynthesis